MSYAQVLCGVYSVNNLINQKRYIGISNNIYRRWNEHKQGALHPCSKDEEDKALYNAMRKYGWDNFELEIIELCSLEELKEKEIYWIAYYDTYYHGYNETKGGDYVGEKSIHYGEDHPKHILTKEDVIQCRKWYQEGKRLDEIYQQYFSDRGITREGFSNMWHGRTWSYIMPEVFENNPHPRQKVTQQDIEDIQNRYENLKESVSSIAKDYIAQGKLGYGTVWSIAHHQRGF